MIFKKNDNVVARKIHDSFFLIDISDNYSNNKCALFEINETGMFIWNNINGFRTVEDLVALLNDAIIDDVDFQIPYDDVVDFIDTLITKRFI